MPPPEPERPFAEPWHAQLFATTHALARAGAFAWPDWAAHLGDALARADTSGAPKDGSTYYEVWLEAFEAFLAVRGLAGAGALGELKAAWRDAYIATPHGQPVELGTRHSRRPVAHGS